MNTVTILRGLPGSGKSTWAEAQPDAVVCSADQFFVGDDGVYQFDPAKLGAAHLACYVKFTSALVTGKPHVIVDNTNTTVREMRRYVDAALAHGYRVSIRTFSSSVEESLARNVHGVPLSSIERMEQRWSTVPNEWKGFEVHHDEEEG